VLEDLRVPIDCIAGTSIGSIVGGLYATGMSPAAMDSTLSSIVWLELFDDRPPRRLVSFRRKAEDYLPYLDFEVGLGEDGLTTPAGAVAGPKLLFLLRALTLSSIGTDSFDDLPIPYRAVAADLADGSLVVVDRGTVADAMRASMAIPGAFTPHVVDGRTLVDGGFLRNVPYDVVKAMGADVVIVVDVGPTFAGLKPDPSLLGILDHTVTMTIVANARESLGQLGDRDLLLTPELGDIGVEDFDRMGETVGQGVSVATAQIDRLRELAVSADEYEAWRSGVRAAGASREIRIDEVRVESPGRIDPRRVRRRIVSSPDAPLDLAVLSEDLARVYRIGEFEMVDFTLPAAAEPPERDLVIRTKDKRWGPHYLRVGLALTGDASGQTDYQVLLYHRLAAINRLGAEWRNQLSLGTPLALDTEFYQPLVMSERFFVAPRLQGSLDERRRWLTTDQAELVDAKQYRARLNLGLNMSHWGELRLGAYHGNYRGKSDGGSLDADERLGGWRGHLAFDQLDDVHFPRRGWSAHVVGRLARSDLGADTEYDRLRTTVRGAVTTGRTTFLGRLEGGTSFGTSLPFHDRFELGGFTRLSGLEPGRLFGDDLLNGSVGVQMRVARLSPVAGGNVYLGLLGEAGQTWLASDDPSLSDVLFGLGAYLGVETLLGPFYIGYGWIEGGHHALSVHLGRTF
jgi:NTE family protein